MQLAETQNQRGVLVNLQNQLDRTGQASGLASGSLPEIIGFYISIALSLLGIVLVVYVILAGFKWMTAQGDGKKVDDAKAMIKNAVIGLIIIFAAYAITNFVIQALATVPGGA